MEAEDHYIQQEMDETESHPPEIKASQPTSDEVDEISNVQKSEDEEEKLDDVKENVEFVPVTPTSEIPDTLLQSDKAGKDFDEGEESIKEKKENIESAPVIPTSEIPDTLLQSDKVGKDDDDVGENIKEKKKNMESVPTTPASEISDRSLQLDDTRKDDVGKQSIEEGKEAVTIASLEVTGDALEAEKVSTDQMNLEESAVMENNTFGSQPEQDNPLAPVKDEDKMELSSQPQESDHDEEKAQEMQSSEGEQIGSEEESVKEQSKKDKKATLANVSRFLKSKREKVTFSGDEGETPSGDESDTEKVKKKKGALGHVSRFLGKAVKKDKEKEQDMFADLALVSRQRNSDEMSYSEEREEIPPQILQCVAATKFEIQKIREIIHQISKSLVVRPRIVTYKMVEESKDLKKRIMNLVNKIPDNIIALNLLESDDSKDKCKEIWRVIGQELDAMNLLAETIHGNLCRRRI